MLRSASGIVVSALCALVLLIPSQAAAQDSDGDGLSDVDEMMIHNSDPTDPDSDGDALLDGDEVLVFGSRPDEADSDGAGLQDGVEVLFRGSNPNVPSDDATAAAADGGGALTTWVRAESAVTVNTLAVAIGAYRTVDAPFDFFSFRHQAEIDFTDSTGASGGAFTQDNSIPDIFGSDVSRFASKSSGWLYVPAAPAAATDNVYTFAVGSDDGFRLRVFDGTTTQEVSQDTERAFATGPLLTVNFPLAGGLFPLEVFFYENLGASGVELSWARGQRATFNTMDFELIPAESFASPYVVANQRAIDRNGGQVVGGDTLDVEVTVRNTGNAPLFNPRHAPRLLTRVTFVGYNNLPPGASVDGVNPNQLNLPPIPPGGSLTFSYEVTVDTSLNRNHAVQGQIAGDTSDIPGIGEVGLRVVTDNFFETGLNDSGNVPVGYDSNIGTFDDDPNIFARPSNLTPPEVDITSPADGSVFTTLMPVTLSGTSSPGSQVFLVEDTTATPIMTDAMGDWTTSYTPPGEGTVEVIVIALIGMIGNGDDDRIRLTFDLTAPSLVVTTPNDGDTVTTSTPRLEGTSEPGATITVSAPGGMMTTTTVNPDGTWALDAPMLPEGMATLNVTATDTAGNVSTPVALAITVQTVMQSIAIVDPSDGEALNTATPTVSGTSLPMSSIEVRVDGGMPQTTTADAMGNWSITLAMLMDGPRTIVANIAGAMVSDTVNVTVDTQAPAVAITSPADMDTVSQARPTITGTAEAGGMVSVDIDGQILMATADMMGNWSVQPTQDLANGNYTVTASQTDEAGNTGSSQITFTVARPVLTVTSPTDGAEIAIDQPVIQGTALPGASVTVTVDMGMPETVTADMNGVWSLMVMAPLADGPHRIDVSTDDGAGGMLSETVNFEVDTVAPVVTITSPADNDVLQDRRPTITGTGEPGGMITVTIDGITLMGVVDMMGNWSLQPTQDLPDGRLTVTATQSDVAGNTGTAQISIVIANMPNAVTITAPVEASTINDPNPTISGVAPPNAMVSVSVDGAMARVATADAMGNWTLQWPDALAEGPHTVSASIMAPMSMDTVDFNVDLTPPAVAITDPADMATVADTRPTVTGTADPGVTVEVTIGGETLTATATMMGTWSVQPSSDLGDGTYVVEARARDDAGNVGSAQITLIVDAVMNTLAISSPINGEVLDMAQPTVTGTAQPGAQVQVDFGGGQIVDVTADAMGNWSAPAPAALADGDVTVVASVDDGMGGREEAIVMFVVDTQAPMVTIEEPLDGASTNVSTPLVRGSTEPGAQVRVDFGGGQSVDVIADNMGVWQASPPMMLGEGQTTVTVTATDAAGNMGSATAMFTIDLSPPQITFTSPGDGAVLNDSQPTVTGQTEPGATVSVIFNGGAPETVVADAMGNWSATAPAMLAQGTVTVDATATDAAGNTGPSAQLQFTNDDMVPDLAITAPTPGQTVNTGTPTITGTTEPGATVRVSIDGGADIETTADAMGDWSVQPAAPLSDGPHVVQARAQVAQGPEASASVSFTVDTGMADVVITTPQDMAVVNDASPTIEGTADASAMVTITIDGEVAGTTTADAAGAWSFTPDDALAEGDHTIVASVDGATDEITITVDTVAPVLTFAEPGDGGRTNDTTPTLSGTSDPGATVEISIGGMVVGTTTADDMGDWSFEVSDALDEGEVEVRLVATDEAGNTTELNEAFIIDVTAPTLTLTQPAEGDTVGTGVVVAGTAEPGSTVEVRVDGELIDSAPVDDEGNWSVTVPASPGEREISVVALDDAGNSSDPVAVRVTVTEMDDDDPFLGNSLQGGCSSAAAPGSGPTWPWGGGVMVVLALLGLRRRNP